RRIATLAGDRRIGEREHEQRERKRADQGGAGAGEYEQERDRERKHDRRPHDVSGYERREWDTEIQPSVFLFLSSPRKRGPISRGWCLWVRACAGTRWSHCPSRSSSAGTWTWSAL